MKRPLVSPHPAHASRRLIFTAKSKGGVGASTLALCIADQFDLADLEIEIIQVDRQARLAQSIGRDVISINLSIAEARRDPALVIRAFDPIASQIEQMRQRPHAALVDFGPTETARFLEYAQLGELGDELVDARVDAVVFVPAVTEPEAIRAAAATLSGFGQALPSVRRVFVRNERDGKFERLHSSSEAARAWHEELAPQLSSCAELVMPGIEAGSWRWFEAACMRFTTAVGLSTEQVMALTGLSCYSAWNIDPC